MNILLLGGSGMAGHVIVKYLQDNVSSQICFTTRQPSQLPESGAVQLDLTDEAALYSCLKRTQPDLVVNAAGILNDEASRRIGEAIHMNSLLPHRLCEYGRELGFRLIHISTDCVFSGAQGSYTEEDRKDAISVYGMTKNLGEVDEPNHLTIRTSIVGPELKLQGIGLFHWFMRQSGSVQGYRKVWWNGVTTLELAQAIAWVIRHPVDGLVHLTGTRRISKYELLKQFKQVFQRDEVDIIPQDSLVSDKTLLNTREDFKYPVRDYETMIAEMKVWMERNRRLYPHYNWREGI